MIKRMRSDAAAALCARYGFNLPLMLAAMPGRAMSGDTDTHQILVCRYPATIAIEISRSEDWKTVERFNVGVGA